MMVRKFRDSQATATWFHVQGLRENKEEEEGGPSWGGGGTLTHLRFKGSGVLPLTHWTPWIPTSASKCGFLYESKSPGFPFLTTQHTCPPRPVQVARLCCGPGERGRLYASRLVLCDLALHSRLGAHLQKRRTDGLAWRWELRNPVGN